jgi:hypothetical protein
MARKVDQPIALPDLHDSLVVPEHVCDHPAAWPQTRQQDVSCLECPREDDNQKDGKLITSAG